jgi:ribose 1,5-bisphosphokinase
VSGGLFVAIVGPSGAGKDSLIRAYAARWPAPDLTIARRVITRGPDPHEDHDALNEDAFVAAERAGGFALSWSAHGLRYGLPVALDVAMGEGRLVIANLSRSAVTAARSRYAACRVALVTASPEALAARLAARGREIGAARERRLARAQAPELVVDATIRNEGALDAAADALAALIARWRQGAPA